MPADVNVTEKVARAIAGVVPARNRVLLEWLLSDDDDASPPPPVTDTDRARAALSTLTDPEVLAGIAGVLWEHEAAWDRDGVLYGCQCGEDYDGETRRERAIEHGEHQAINAVEWLRGRA